MRGFASIVTFILLAACGDSGLAPLPTDQIRVGFPPGGVVDVIQVDAVDRLPLRKAESDRTRGPVNPGFVSRRKPGADHHL